MLLKKLEAYGFKSFADKLDLDFGPGITAVVGPNGSGKSNITEAIRWVLGEQSAKNLRGHKMEDVIFVGSERRKPLGIAEVSLTLDNHDQKLPIEFSEVTITRRVFRSGESEFFINKVPCRLKDIAELISDTGLGREALSVISQNQVDEILNNRPEDRRAVFEEAAGITKYKNRKREAVRRLEETQQNLLRVHDILSELELQLEPLAEAAGKAEQYLVLENRFKQLDIEVIFHKINVLAVNIESIQLQCNDLEDKLMASNAQMAKAEADREITQNNLGKLENLCQAVESQLQNVNHELQQLESNMLLAQERIHNYQEKQQRLQSDIMEYDTKIAGLQQEMEREQGQIKAIHQQLAEHRQNVLHKERLVQETTERINQGAQCVANSKDAVLDHLQLLAQKRNNLQSLRTEAEMVRRTLAKLHQEADEQQTLSEDTVQQQKKCVTDISVKQTLIRQNDAAVDNEQRAYSLAVAEQKKINACGNILQTRLNDLASRYKVLLDMQKSFEGYSFGVKAIMSQQATPWSDNICGIVADLVQVPAEYALAVEVALGGALQNIVTEDAETAKAAIAFLKRAKRGRATFLPLDAIKASPARDYEIAAADVGGALGFAVDLVSYDVKYRAVMNFLLGHIIIARNLDAALEIARNARFRLRIVTLEGDVISPGGAMTGGSNNKKGSGLLGRRRELQDLQAAIVLAEQELQGNREQLQTATNKTAELTAHLQQLQEEKQLFQIEIAGLEKEAAQLNQEISRLAKMRQVLEAEMLVQNRIIDTGQGKVTQLLAEISELEATDRETQEAIQVYQQDVEQQRSLLQEASNATTELKIRLATIEQEAVTAERIIERLQKLNTTYQQEKQVKLRETAEIEQALAQLAGDMEKWRETSVNTALQRDSQTTVLQQHKTQRYQLSTALSGLEKQLRELRRGNQELQSQLHEMQLKKTHYGHEYETNCRYLVENYQCNWAEQRHEYKLAVTLAEAETALADWREKLQVMGPVNLTAIEEYQRISERFDFLNKQAEDLSQAQEALSQVIMEMDTTMRKQFIAAFQAISEEFMVAFGELFEGGHARLQLTNKENVLETGIDIIAQPPGKKLQNLSLLSGGERALTVIALLFAMLRVKPTPFCVVDEIDAALDEVNVSRFAQFLRRLSQNSQFIVITHRKGTMEQASVMHGITMAEQGVSKLISVKFMEAG